MRYAIVSETYPPEVNGVALTVQALETGLRARGHHVNVIRPRQADEAVAGAEQMLVRGAPLPRYPGLRFGLPAGRALMAQWRRQRPDAIYVATEGPLGWSAVRSARKLAIPVMTGLHTRFDEYVERYGAGFLTPVAFAWMRRFHNMADATIVPTDDLAVYLRRRGFNDVRVLRRAVDSKLFDPTRRDACLRASWGLGDDDLAVMYLGRIAPEKNLELAVRAFRAIREQQPKARFVWVGEGPARAAIEKANPDSVFAGLRRGEDLARHFASADLFLFPSLTETFGNVTLEAMASGVPTVAFDYGAAHDHLRNGVHGAAVKFGDHDAFLRAAVHVAADPRMRRAMGAQARASVATLSPESVTHHFDMLLSSFPIKRKTEWRPA